MINYGVVGTGYFGADLARILNELEDSRVSCVFDPENGQAVAEELNCDNVASLEVLCSRSDVDCVVVATPNFLHKEPVLVAAKHKKHVFCEKPIALSYEDCSLMVNACKEAGVIFFAGHVMNFFNGVHLAKEFISKGKIGKLLFIHTARNGWEDMQPSVSWKKMREKSGGHLYHHIHELDCVQFLMDGIPDTVTMMGGNVAHQGANYGDEDDLLIANLKFSDNRYALLEWGSAFHYGEHYVLIQGTKGYIKLDMSNCGGTLMSDGVTSHFTIHENQAEDDDRTRIYHEKNGSGAIQYGKPGIRTPLWLYTIMVKELKYLNSLINGAKPTKEFEKLSTGEAARNAIATADALTLSRNEGRVVSLSEIINKHK